MSMRFCTRCNNRMNPCEDRQNRSLTYKCRVCQFTVPADDTVVFRNELVQDTETRLEIVHASQYQDPTLQRTRETRCPLCGDQDAVFFQAAQSLKSQALHLVFVCKCGYKWVL